MDLLPAIDVRSGRVVRLSQGEPTRQTVYGDDPATVAEAFVAAGAPWIHLVDLDRAFGTGENQRVLARVIVRVKDRVRIQLGGGLRTLELIQSALGLGVHRVVIGTAAAVSPSLLQTLVSELGAERLAVGIDARDGYVALRGWTETSNQRAVDLARRVAGEGIETVVYTDISRDGMLAGPDLEGAAKIQASGVGVIVSGGVASAEDIRATCQAGFAGVIVGRALYDERVTIREALAAADCRPE